MEKKAGRPGGKTIALQERLKKIAMASRASRVKNSYSGASLLWLSFLGHPVCRKSNKRSPYGTAITTSGCQKTPVRFTSRSRPAPSFATTKAGRETFGCLVFSDNVKPLIANTGTAAEYSAERYKIVMCQYLAQWMIFCDTKAHERTIALKCLSRLGKMSCLSHINIGRHFGITVAHSDAVQSGRMSYIVE